MNEGARTQANGCPAAAGEGSLSRSLGALILLALVLLSGCYENTRVNVRVTQMTGGGVCIERADGQPSTVNRSGDWADHVDLPRTVVVGRCVVLESHHPLMHFVEFVDCPV